MQIKIVNSWLKEYLETNANPKEIAKQLSLASVSVERTYQIGTEHIYDIEVTTNRVDLMSVSGIAKETTAVLTEKGIPAKYTERKIRNIPKADISFPIEIINNPKLVNRILAVVLEIEIDQSPKRIKDRLELSGIRSLNNVIDVTNYVMREIGHPAHVFDFDLLNTKKMIIRESKQGEVLTTLDGKQYRLMGGDIVAEDGKGEIIDLLGVMGTANSVVQNNTKRIIFFLNNSNPKYIRKTSMSLGIRSEAAIINEKGVDPELMEQAFKRGVELYQEIAKGKVISKILDIYPTKTKAKTIKVSIEKINKIIGVDIPARKSSQILESLNFKNKIFNNYLEVSIPTIRVDDVTREEDIIEEIARIFGYHKLPSVIPNFLNNKNIPYYNNFYFENRVKNALKYWGFTETYTYSLIPEDLFDGPIENAIKIKNPLTQDMRFMRNSLVPSLLKVVEDNKNREVIKIFELSNTYHKRQTELPQEIQMLSGIIKKRSVSFFEVKGLIEQLLTDLGIINIKFKQKKDSPGADVFIEGKEIGYIEILDNNTIDFELNFEEILNFTNVKKTYKPLAKFPNIIEDITFILSEEINTEDIIDEIKLQNLLIKGVTLKDEFENSKTFRITYQAEDKNLTNKDVEKIRYQIIEAVSEKFKASVK